MGYNVEYYTDEIADALCKILNIENRAIKDDLDEALFQLRAIVENPYNRECYKTLYMVLESLTYHVGTGDIRATEF